MYGTNYYCYNGIVKAVLLVLSARAPVQNNEKVSKSSTAVAMIAVTGDETKVATSNSEDVDVPAKEPKKRSRALAAGESIRGVDEVRKSANRKSAFESRLRKKVLTDDLQQQVVKLQSELVILKETNRTLLKNLETSLAENRRLRFVYQHSGRFAGEGAGLGNQNATAFLGGMQAGGFNGVMGFHGF